MTSKRLQTAQKWVGHLATMDTEVLEPLLAENYTHVFRPGSLGEDLPPTVGKQGRLEIYRQMKKILVGFPLIVHEYIESESSNSVTIWAKSRAVWRREAMGESPDPKTWIYDGEYILILTMDESGEKITRCLEFLDSKVTADVIFDCFNRGYSNIAKLE